MTTAAESRPGAAALRGACVGAPDSKAASRALLKSLARFRPAEIAARSRTALNLMRALGMAPPSVSCGEGGLDLLPHVLPPAEWEALEAGVAQRFAAMRALTADIYSSRRILRERIVPPETILTHPAYLRDCVGLRGPRLAAAAFDLVRETGGPWRLVRDHLAFPTLAAFALQNRRTQSQVFSESFEGLPVQPVGAFTHGLRGAILGSGSARRAGRTVLLSAAAGPAAAFEHSFLARKMGLTMALTQDLTVRGGRLFLKTVRGLERIDAVFRAGAGDLLDPVVMPGREGVPGLLACLRRRSAAVSNPYGCAAAESRALWPFTDRIIRFYLGSRALLQPLPAYRAADRDQALLLRDNPGAFRFFTELHEAVSPDSAAAVLAARPDELVAHRPAVFDTLPLLGADGTACGEAPFLLRCFAHADGGDVRVMPGGLTLLAPGGDPLDAAAWVCKDTWVLAPSRARREPRAQGEAAWAPRALGSRVAEALYWMGRYAERAETTARMLNVLDEIRIEAGGADVAVARPLWQALAAALGTPIRRMRARILAGYPAAVFDIALGAGEPHSVLTSLRRAADNARTLMDYVSPEAFTVISRLEQSLGAAAGAVQPGAPGALPAVRAALDAMLSELAAFHGMAARTMLHDEGSHFFHAGLHVERLIFTLTAAATAFGSALVRDSRHVDSDLENPVLAGLLRMLGCQDAYRRRFQRGAQPGPVAKLLLASPQLPASAAFCLGHLRRFLHPYRARCAAAVRIVNGMADAAESGRTAALLGGRGARRKAPLAAWRWAERIGEANHAITDALFNPAAAGDRSFTAEFGTRAVARGGSR